MTNNFDVVDLGRDTHSKVHCFIALHTDDTVYQRRSARMQFCRRFWRRHILTKPLDFDELSRPPPSLELSMSRAIDHIGGKPIEPLDLDDMTRLNWLPPASFPEYTIKAGSLIG